MVDKLVEPGVEGHDVRASYIDIICFLAMDKTKGTVAIGREAEEDGMDDIFDLEECQLPLSFTKKRHVEKIEGTKTVTQTWRMKERMKTVSVALVMCLNVGVDPPDIVKTSPCARMECWIDPLAMSPQKSLEAIGAGLQRQYERWQPRARYKQSLDPTSDEVKKLCTSLRRNAKEERVLFHYNGHGVPRPTVNGELWVFNKSYTQYIPLSVYDLQMWMGSPSIYVYDCSHAGIIVESFKQFSQQREQEMEQRYPSGSNAPPPSPSVKNCIQLAACGSKELLPMNPDLPADLFTSCLTTPIKIALRWFVLQNHMCLVPGINMETIDKIPGQLNDRRTMLGELNWIFTAITDTIAWNTLPRDLFQKLFRQDLLVASLFRNFLLAERIMRAYNCTPVSSPKLPPTYMHPMWQAWDLALDLCLSQLPGILNEKKDFQHSYFFAEQLTAFQVWLGYGSEKRNPPEQLPIVLQVLLSQVHRLRALDLLGRFLDLGPWAVSRALSVGIFPYVLKLLQSSARELRHLLVFIWAKILAVDSSCQADLVKDNGHKYFLSVLSDPYMPAEHRTMAAFVLAMIVNNYPNGQEVALQGNLIAHCLEQLNDPNHMLRQWLALCLGKIWTNFDAARWCGVRDSAHEKLYKLLTDPIPEVRAAAVYALGTFINNSTERSDHANNIDHGVGMTVCSVLNDGSPLVRMELVVALGGLVSQFEMQFASFAFKILEEEKLVGSSIGLAGDQRRLETRRGSDTAAFAPASTTSGMRRSASSRSLRGLLSPGTPNNINPLGPLLSVSQENLGPTAEVATPVKRVPSTSSMSGMSIGLSSVYGNIWKVLIQLMNDPMPKVAEMAKTLTTRIKAKATASAVPRHITPKSASQSAPSSPSNKPSSHISPIGETPPNSTILNSGDLKTSPVRPTNLPGQGVPYSAQFLMSRKMFDKGPNGHAGDDGNDSDSQDGHSPKDNLVQTEFFEWCCRYFAQPVMTMPKERDPESEAHHEQEFRMERAASVKLEATEEQRRAGFSRLDDQIFINRNQNIPTVLRFHPFEPMLMVADKDGISVWEWEQGVRLNYFNNCNPKRTRITSMEFINPHDRALLLTGTDDGAVRIWRDCYGEGARAPRLVSSWQALSDMLPSNRGSGLVLDWEQHSGTLLASGDVRSIRIWDTNRELKVQDIPTGADSCVTSLMAGAAGRSLLIAGCGDGSVRLYDRRMPANECRVRTLWEHKSWVVNVHLQRGTEGKIISASVGGDIRFWDPRFTESVKCINTTQGLTALEVHRYADVIACGSANQFISIFNQSGDSLSTIKYHEGFMGQRIGPITAMAFHPYRVKLAAASTDAFVSVYSNPDYRRR